jgi:hypothetical protein
MSTKEQVWTEEEWVNDYYAEVERLFDGRLPRCFNIEHHIYFPSMSPHEAAINYFVGYWESRIVD